jgi:HSP20 family protein
MTYPVRPRWDPFAQLQSLRAELGRLFAGSAGGRLLAGSNLLPEVEVDRDADGWTVIARLPGVAPEEVAIEVDARELRIRARTVEETEPATELATEPATELASALATEPATEHPAGQHAAGPHERNGARRGFDYRLSLGGELDVDRVDATMDHGLLTVRLPRLVRGARRQVTIGRRVEPPANRPPAAES